MASEVVRGVFSPCLGQSNRVRLRANGAGIPGAMRVRFCSQLVDVMRIGTIRRSNAQFEAYSMIHDTIDYREIRIS